MVISAKYIYGGEWRESILESHNSSNTKEIIENHKADLLKIESSVGFEVLNEIKIIMKDASMNNRLLINSWM